MGSKRGATSELNHLNWNAEDTPEDAGTFDRARDDIIKGRLIRTARRRAPISSVRSDGDKKSAFESFTGFSKAPPPTSNAFNFLSSLTKNEQPKTNGISEKTVSESASSTTSIFNKMDQLPPKNDSEGQENKFEYYARLKGLNESVSKWIKQHVDENPLINLQPIFKDYENYYEELEEEYKCDGPCATSNVNTSSKPSISTEPSENVSSSSGFASFVFKPTDDIPSTNKPDQTEKPFACRFGVTSTTEVKEPSKFSFGVQPTDQPETPKTSKSAAPQFSFGMPAAKKVKSDEKQSETGTPQFSFGIPAGKNAKSAEKKSEPVTPNFNFGSKGPETVENKSETKAPTFSFGIENAKSTQNTAVTETPKFMFSSGNSTTTKSQVENTPPKFTFGNGNASSTKSQVESTTPKFSFGSGNTLSAKSNAESTAAKLAFSNSESLPVTKPQSKNSPAKFTFGSASSVKESENTPGKFAFSSGNTSSTKEKDSTPGKFPFDSGNASSGKEAESTPPRFTFGSATKQSDSPKLTFGSGNTSTQKTSETEAPKFSFGTGTSASTTSLQFGSSTAPSFSFGSSSLNTTAGFSFPKPSMTAGFTFTNVARPESTEDKEENDENDEPPKVEFTPVVEEGHTYTTRCKVFVKKDNNYSDRGVGTLFLKPVPDSEKTQLIVRADTSIGNVLCNFILSENIPVQRMGKKDVMLVCLPTPEFKPPPVPILLRVKSPEDADKLYETLKKYKK